MRKMFSIALALVILFTLSVPALANNTVTMYCKAPPEWGTCYIYWWGGAEKPEWPGLPMEKDSDGAWSYAIPDDAKNVIFSDNGSNQTPDLTIPANGKNLYDVALKRWIGDGSDQLEYYLVGYINDADYGIGEDSANFGDHRFVNNQVTVSFTGNSYVLIKDSDGIQYKTMAYSEKTEDTFCVEGTEKMFVAGNQTVTFTLTVNEDGTLIMSYLSDCDHTYEEQITTEATCDHSGEKTFTCSKCAHSYVESIPASGHQFANGVCAVCGANEGDISWYLVGYINGADIGIAADSDNLGQYAFTDGRVTVEVESDSYVVVKNNRNELYMTDTLCEETTGTLRIGGTEKIKVPGGQSYAFTLTVNDDSTLTLSYQPTCEHDYQEEISAEATCNQDGKKTFSCTKCDHSYTEAIPAIGHQFVDGVCSLCNAKESDVPPVVWYLVGYINGVDVGIDTGSDNLGPYVFTDGKVVVNVESDSYVVVMNNNYELYMTDTYCEETSAILRDDGGEKIKVPGGKSYTFTLVVNDGDTVTLSYELACAHNYQEKVTKEPTCDKAGEKTYTCSECAHSYTEPVPATGVHHFVENVCSICGAKNGEQKPQEKPQDNDPAKVTLFAKVPEGWTTVHAYTWEGETAHSGKWPGTAMEKEGQWYRLEIDAKATNAIINNGGDQQKTPDQIIDTKYDIYITVADDGSASVEQGAENGEKENLACEHAYVEKVTTAATCEKTGEKTFTCSKCSHSKTEVLAALGHKFSNDVCTVCGIKKIDAKPVDNDPAKVTLFVKVPEGWTPVNAYTWEGETPYNGQWPGAAMQKDGNWFRIEIDAKVANVVINNGGDQKKTEDLSIKTDRDIYITVKEGVSAVIEYGAENKKETTPPSTPDTPAGEDFPLSNFRVVGNASWMGQWDPASDAGRMRQCGANRYFLQVKDVPAGTYEFKITENGTWDRSWGTKDGKNETFTLNQKGIICIYFELNGEDYKIEVDYDPGTGDVDLFGIVAIMGIAVLAAGALLLGRKKFLQ